MGLQVGGMYLVRVTRKVVNCLARACGALRDSCVAAIVGLEDGKLPALRVVELDVDLAVFAVFLGSDTLARLRDEVVVDEGQRRQICREHVRDRAGWAARARISEASDLNLVSAGAVPLDEGGSGHSSAGEKGNDVQ